MNKIPNIAKRRLAADPAITRQDIGPHLDANLLSAFAENLLDLNGNGKERSMVIEHLGKCFDCREALFLAQPELDASNIVHVTKSVRRWNAIRWGAWAACAVIVIVGAAVIKHQQTQQGVPQNQIAVMQSPSANEFRVQPQVLPNTVTPETTIESKQLDAKKSEPMARVAKAPVSIAKDDEKDAGMNMQMADAAPASTKAAPEANSPSNLPASNLPATRQAFTSEMKPNSANMAMLSKSSGPRWTLTADGSLQRSLDSGKTWQAVTVAPNSTFRAIAAIGSEIWVGGAAGSLYHSSNAGDDWQQIKPSAAGDTLTADITALSFPDAQHGSVSAGGETWITSDAGQSWQKK